MRRGGELSKPQYIETKLEEGRGFINLSYLFRISSLIRPAG